MQSKEARQALGRSSNLYGYRMGAPSHRYGQRSRTGNETLPFAIQAYEKVCRGAIVNEVIDHNCVVLGSSVVRTMQSRSSRNTHRLVRAHRWLSMRCYHIGARCLVNAWRFVRYTAKRSEICGLDPIDATTSNRLASDSISRSCSIHRARRWPNARGNAQGYSRTIGARWQVRAKRIISQGIASRDA